MLIDFLKRICVIYDHVGSSHSPRKIKGNLSILGFENAVFDKPVLTDLKRQIVFLAHPFGAGLIGRATPLVPIGIAGAKRRCAKQYGDYAKQDSDVLFHMILLSFGIVAAHHAREDLIFSHMKSYSSPMPFGSYST